MATARTAQRNLETEVLEDFRQWEEELIENVDNVQGELLANALYENHGRLRNIIEDNPNNRAWTGNISVDQRLGRDLNRQDLHRALEAQNIHRYYVRCSLDSRARCIDGRCLQHYEHSQSADLGPQVPGGTATAALCRRVGDIEPLEDDYNPRTDDDQFTASTFIEDIEDMRRLLDVIHWKAGGHIDEHAGEGKTGCGAIDRLPEILERITLAGAQTQIRGLSKALLGDHYDEATVDELMGRFLYMQGKADTYFARDDDGHFEYLQEAIERLKQDGGVAKLMGAHKEVALVVNMIKDTTYHRDQFSTDNDHNIQLFNYDFWYSIQLAEHVATNRRSNNTDLTSADHQNIVNRFITTRVLYSIATAMVLTDGSLGLIVRSEA